MRLKYILLISYLALISTLSTVAQEQTFKYNLKVIMPQSYNNKVAYLRVTDYLKATDYNSFKKCSHLDSTLIRNNEFSFNGTINKECEHAYLWIKDPNGSNPFRLTFLIDAGNHVININKIDTTYYQHIYDNYPDNLSDVDIVSSPTNDLYRKIDMISNSFYRMYGIIQEGCVNAKCLPRERSDELNTLKLELVKKNWDNFYSLIYLRSNLNTYDEEVLLSVFKTLDQRLKNSTLGRELDSLLIERIYYKSISNIGNVVPEFTINTFEGKVFKNKDLSGQSYLIVFSATWCGPCQKELPKLIELYNKYKNNGLKVVYFNLDDNVERWGEHIKKNNLNWINVSEKAKFKDSKIATLFHVYGIPTCFVIDKTGKIIYNSDQMNIGLDQLEGYIKKAIGNEA